MAYTITKSDGTLLTTIADGSRDTTTSLSLAGPNFVGYGKYLNENLVYLLENFASNATPSSTNLQGQLWFDKYNQVLKVFTAQGYVPVSGVTNSGSQPLLAKNGDIWFNTTTEQMYLYDTSGAGGFKIIGPSYTKQQGVSGTIPLTLEDAAISGTFHNVVKIQFGNLTYATFSADPTFTPNPPLPGFTTINPGITFSSNVASPTFNANLYGTVIGSVVGDVRGNVIATTVSGHLYGDVTGNLTGNVTATNLSGNLSGNVSATNAQATNFSSSNVAITGGYINNLANVTATNGYFTTVTATNIAIDNVISTNVAIVGGNITSLTNLSSTNAQLTNLSSSNVLVAGGSVTGLTNLSATTAQATNFSSSNILVSGGSATALTNFSATNAQATNFTSGNAQITGGSTTGLTNVSGTIAQFNQVSSQNAQITGGNVSGVTGVGVTFTTAVLNNSVATTRNVTDKSTAIATTAFVHTVLPIGVIVMWGGQISAIPSGWQLCDGSNGTPNLRGQFIVGAGSTYSPGDQGGAASVTLDATQMPIHNHTLAGTINTTAAGGHTHTVNDPGHNHSYTAPNNNNSTPSGSFPCTTTTTGTTSTATTGITINPVTDHVHTVSLTGTTLSAGGSSGTTQAHENRPPYYALCYIQKMY
jgi:microcystin-dependent protein